MSQTFPRAVVVMFDTSPRRAVSEDLANRGYEIIEVESHRTGLWKLVEEHPKLLIFDRYGPEGSDILDRLSAMRLELKISGASTILIGRAPPSEADATLAREIGGITFVSGLDELRAVLDRTEHPSSPEGRPTPSPLLAKTPIPEPTSPAGPATSRDPTPIPKRTSPAGPATSRDPTPIPKRTSPAGPATSRDPTPIPEPTSPAGPATSRDRPAKEGAKSSQRASARLRGSASLRLPTPPPRKYQEEVIHRGGSSSSRSRFRDSSKPGRSRPPPQPVFEDEPPAERVNLRDSSSSRESIVMRRPKPRVTPPPEPFSSQNKEGGTEASGTHRTKGNPREAPPSRPYPETQSPQVTPPPYASEEARAARDERIRRRQKRLRESQRLLGETSPPPEMGDVSAKSPKDSSWRKANIDPPPDRPHDPKRSTIRRQKGVGTEKESKKRARTAGDELDLEFDLDSDWDDWIPPT